MSPVRWLILLVGPLPIVGTSWAVSAWFRPEPSAPPGSNLVFVAAPHSAAVAGAAEKRGQGAAGGKAGLAEACQRAAARWRAELGGGCHVVAHAPFVVAGDVSLARLEGLYDDTILPAAEAMRVCYFKTEPSQPVTLLLFQGEESYNRYCRQLFGDSGVSVFGYYKPRSRTVVLNLATGGGTLVHELTHALIDFDFPEVPAWFNEGLASLHEQCRFRGGDGGPWIEGLVNWRLPGLQKAIRLGQLRSLKSLIEESDFRGPLQGTNYAHARYFCMYLQQMGVLENCYRIFRRDRLEDPQGVNSVRKALRQTTWLQIDRDFQRWALDLGEKVSVMSQAPSSFLADTSPAFATPSWPRLVKSGPFIVGMDP